MELVACTIDRDGKVTECDRRCHDWAGQWAWRHPHQADGSVTYTPLAGDVRLFDVDFAYEPGHTVLHNVSLYAKPGQKVAFVGATGAGKTTITNLLNRFYDIEDGKIRYDGININKIKKPDLRRSLGVVLQDVNLFTGTVMDNIRYGRLDATDEECIAAARLAGADDFVRRLPEGYDTWLTDNGAALSQGQRQLLSIARAAVADPPVMVLDEATSSIDTRTEAIVQRGHGRAHDRPHHVRDRAPAEHGPQLRRHHRPGPTAASSSAARTTSSSPSAGRTTSSTRGPSSWSRRLSPTHRRPPGRPGGLFLGIAGLVPRASRNCGPCRRDVEKNAHRSAWRRVPVRTAGNS